MMFLRTLYELPGPIDALVLAVVVGILAGFPLGWF